MVATTLLASFLLLFHGVFLLLFMTTAGLYYVSHIYGPTLKFPEATGRSHLGQCGPSTDKLEDIVVNETFSPEAAVQVVETHGAAVFSDVITKKAAQNLRDYAMTANHKLESSFIQAPNHRYHVMPPHTEPSVQETLKQVAEHPVVRPVIDRLLGPNSTLVSLSLVTSEYGASDQGFHSDADTSQASYPDLIVPEYTLAIALQDVTKKMGSTGLCPGTQRCKWPDFDWDELRKLYEKDKEDGTFKGTYTKWWKRNIPCNVTADMSQGDAMLYNSDVMHRGRAHTDRDAPERALLFITFAGSRLGPDDKRSLPLRQVHALDWRMWGHTIDDFITMQERPWRPWHIFGLFNSKGNVRPWNLVDEIMIIFAHESELAHVISDEFSEEYLRNLVENLVIFTLGFAILYISTLLTCVLVVIVLIVIPAGRG